MVQVAGWILAITIRYSLYWLELLALLILYRRSLRSRDAGNRWFTAFERRFSKFARRRRLAVICTGLAALAARAALFPVLPARAPVITDEFSYLLAADTFASGRLTNPTHPLWPHFETMHVIQHPSYASMYHLAQGMILAAGQALTGHPWTGVYLSVAVMCALLCWMLQGWLPPQWALLGGALAILRLGLFGYWINSYWGGAAAAIGGLLVLGALPRITRRPSVLDSSLLALGVIILANSRPYEGFVLCLPVAGFLLAAVLKQRSWKPVLLRTVLPAAIVLALGGAATCHYYARVTGSPFRMPYQVDRDQYASAGIFLWEQPRPIPPYRNPQMSQFYTGWELTKFMEAKSPLGLAKNTIGKAGAFWLFFLGPVFTLPFLFLPSMLHDRRIRPLLIIGAVFLAGLAINTWFYAHYAAPVAGLIYALVLQGMRHLRIWRRHGNPSGLFLARGIPVLCVAMVVLRVCAQPLAFFMPPDWPMTWYYTRPGNTERARIQALLEQEPGPQLAIVRYQPGHNFFEEWVYNRANIDAAKVVWARDLDTVSNRTLIQYFHDRRAWLVQTGDGPAALSPYSPAP
ncbi:MAG TPA: hypothetical protein VKT49_03880 [Bryobacteraceae bacterium]|nr:hypothetical protein [Bryobacteraceae bacterium]